MRKYFFIILALFVLNLHYSLADQVKISKSAQKVFVKSGNIYFSSGKNKVQLTKSGKDRAPVLSPDEKNVVFIRQSKEMAYNPIGGADYPRDPHADQIWIMDVDGKNEKLIVMDYNPDAKKGYNKWRGEDVIGWIEDESLQFSPDGKKVYYLTPAWVTSSALRGVNIDGSNEHFIMAANTLKVIEKGKHKGGFIVSQHRYFLAGGSYDWYYVFGQDGKEIGALGEDLETADLDFIYSDLCP